MEWQTNSFGHLFWQSTEEVSHFWVFGQVPVDFLCFLCGGKQHMRLPGCVPGEQQRLQIAGQGPCHRKPTGLSGQGLIVAGLPWYLLNSTRSPSQVPFNNFFFGGGYMNPHQNDGDHRVLNSYSHPGDEECVFRETPWGTLSWPVGESTFQPAEVVLCLAHG